MTEKHRERIRLETEHMKERRQPVGGRRMLVFLLGICLFGLLTPVLGGLHAEQEPWAAVIVGEGRPLPGDFTVDLEQVGGVRVDTRIAPALRRMLRAAEADGVTLSLKAGYRSVKEQAALADDGEGSAAPGENEHHTGLAVDFFVSGTEDFEGTSAYAWLTAYGAEYGFVLRYPAGKEALTGRAFAPQHFRYVGKRRAAAMAEEGKCLEEIGEDS